MLAWNDELAGFLGLPVSDKTPEELALWFSGTEVPQGAEPLAQAYAGHQFGHFVPQLGDGRALLLGEVVARDGQRYDIQLKGSGQTPFSRRGDGRSALGPVIREYLLSEAMHHLGVPTTRALAAVATGETVYRETPTPGGVFTRVASSHLRIGTFQYLASREDLDGLRLLTDYSIQRHYPEAAAEDQPCLAFYRAVVEAHARLVAHWLDVGFIHGVMNTDNTTISGETLDYGPCAFMDEFVSTKVFSSIDHGGRYGFSNQAPVAQWNLARLAECLLMLEDDREGFESELTRFGNVFEAAYLGRMRRKLGLVGGEGDDPGLISSFLRHLEENELDYTVSFRSLAGQLADDGPAAFGDWEARWKARLSRQDSGVEEVAALLHSANPAFIPRNHQVERAIQGANEGDLSVFNELQSVLTRPFDDQPSWSEYARPPSREERVTMTFCGT